MTDIAELLQLKRECAEHTPAQIHALVAGFTSGTVPDYQMSAWLMAATLNGLTLDETLALTQALIDSGERVDLSAVARPVMDKHSTGGVGDKVTLVLAPVVAACGAVFGKFSGRALGHTGGTVDKLESIPGFRSHVTTAQFAAQLSRIGICVSGQSSELVPADQRLYALRDVTATIDSNPLIAASIMSKKIASGAAAVALDVKVGRGSFFRNQGQAYGAVHLMQKIGEAHGVGVRYLMTSMEQPLGRAVGNALEVAEAVETLHGGGAADLVEVVLALTAVILEMSDMGWNSVRSRDEARHALEGGAALAKFREWMTAQGADPAFIDDLSRLPRAPETAEVLAAQSGFIESIDALEVGKTAVELGAGRRRKGDAIDPAVGIVFKAKTGDAVQAGRPLATVHANSDQSAQQAAARIAAACTISSIQTRPPGTFFH